MRPEHGPAPAENHSSPARVYNYLVGGELHSALDRDKAARILTVLPCAKKLAQAHRRFALSAVQRMLAAGITQFLDLGAGLPTAGTAAHAITAATGSARVVLVENHPDVAEQARRIADSRVHVLRADLTDTVTVLDHCTRTGGLDLDRPVGILAIDSLHLVDDHDQLGQALAAYRQAAAAGSVLAVSVLSDVSRTHSLADYLEFCAADGVPTRPVSKGQLLELLGRWARSPRVEVLGSDADLPAIAALVMI